MSEADQSGAGRREVAYRVFAAEYEDADFEYSASNEERAPNYVITPTGARANRIFVVGVLTEIESVNEEMLRARVVDPTGAFVVYAGQYQPDEMAAIERLDPPTFVAVTGKARTFQPDDADTIYTSVRPESISEVDAETRDRWTVQTAERTLDRVAWMATALDSDARGEALRDRLVGSGVDHGLAEGIALAIDHYGTTGEYLRALRETALDSARVVAGEVDEAGPLPAAPDEGATADLSALTDRRLADERPESVSEGGELATSEGDQESSSSPAEAETVTIGESEPAEPTEEARDETETGSEADESSPAPSTAEPEASREPEDAESSASPPPDETSDPDEFDPEEFELDEEEREEIESEYGTEFQSGTEVDEPGEADIETPDPEAETSAGETAPSEADPHPEGDEGGSEQPESPLDEEEQTEGESSVDDGADVDLEDAAVATMEELDGGDGADREAVIEAVVEAHGADPSAVDEAIDDALMQGRCYEPGNDTLKSI